MNSDNNLTGKRVIINKIIEIILFIGKISLKILNALVLLPIKVMDSIYFLFKSTLYTLLLFCAISAIFKLSLSNKYCRDLNSELNNYVEEYRCLNINDSTLSLVKSKETLYFTFDNINYSEYLKGNISNFNLIKKNFNDGDNLLKELELKFDLIFHENTNSKNLILKKLRRAYLDVTGNFNIDLKLSFKEMLLPNSIKRILPIIDIISMIISGWNDISSKSLDLDYLYKNTPLMLKDIIQFKKNLLLQANVTSELVRFYFDIGTNTDIYNNTVKYLPTLIKIIKSYS